MNRNKKTSFKPTYAITVLLVAVIVVAVSCGRSAKTAHEKQHVASTYEIRDWKEAYDKGVELQKNGDLTEASYYFSNALGASPGNFAVIKSYCDTMLELSKREGDSENLAYDISTLQIIEGFLQSQIPLVQTTEVKPLLDMLEDVRSKIVKADIPLLQKNPMYDEMIAKLVGGEYTFEIPDNPDIPDDNLALLLATLQDLDALREYATVMYQKNFDALDLAIAQTQAAIDFQTLSALLAEQKEIVKASCKTSVPD